MATRQIVAMQNNYVHRGRSVDQEGICTITALQWAKKCIERKRGLGNFDELGLTDFQLEALMSVWRWFDNQPVQQTHAIGLRIIGGADRVVSSIRAMTTEVENTAPHIAVFWNSIHTMGFRVGKGRMPEYEWFDNNFGYYVDSDADSLFKFMREKWKERYTGAEGSVKGVRIVDV